MQQAKLEASRARRRMEIEAQQAKRQMEFDDAQQATRATKEAKRGSVEVKNWSAHVEGECEMWKDRAKRAEKTLDEVKKV